MPLTKVRWKDRRGDVNEAPVDEFLAVAAEDPLFPIPYPIAASMLHEDDRPDEGFSITQMLSGCLRCKVLQQFEPYTEDIMDRWFRWRGSMMHGVLERFAPQNAICEVRFFARVPFVGGTVSGKPDIIWNDTIADGKTTKRVPMFSPWSNHVEQLQLYRWLINHAERWDADLASETFQALRSRQFNRLVVWYIDHDGVKPMEIKTSKQVATKPGAKNPTKTVKEPLIWSDEECEAMLTSRYEDLTLAFETYENTHRLPFYPPGFDYISGWEHQYSPTAKLCVERFIEEQTHA